MSTSFPKTEWIWRDGEYVRWEDATLHVMSHVVHYGSSIIEGIRSYDTPEGSVRLTLDTCLRVRAADETRFSDGAATPFLEAFAILELKVGGRMPAICRRFVEEFALSPHNVSKYRLGTTALLNQDGRHAVASRLTDAGVMHA